MPLNEHTRADRRTGEDRTTPADLPTTRTARTDGRVDTYTSVDDLAALGPAGPALELERTLPWLRAEEGRVSPEQYYLVSRRTPATRATCYVVPHDAPHTTYATREILVGAPAATAIDSLADPAERARARSALAELARALPAEATGTLAVVTPGSTRPGLDAVPGDREGVDALLTRAEDLAAGLGLPVVQIGNVRDEPGCADLHRALRERGYTAVTTGADAVLDVTHPDLDAYFAAFRSNRRKVLRKERNRFLADPPQVTVLGPEGLTEDLVELQLDRYLRYGHEADADGVRDRFARAATVPGLRVLRADRNGRPLGFVAFYEDLPHRRTVPRLGAFSTDDQGGYFNLAYYELIAHAAARTPGARIHYGEATYGAKTSRGCRLVRLTSYFRATDPALRAAVENAGSFRSAWEEQHLSAAIPARPHTHLDERKT